MEKFLKRLFVPLVLFIFGLPAQTSCGPVHVARVSSGPRVYSLCGQHNERRIYLESGKSGLITARNVELLPLLPHTRLFTKSNSTSSDDNQDLSSPQDCRIEFVACSSCVIDWKVLKSNISEYDCSRATGDHIEVSESPYGYEVSGHRVCSNDARGGTQTRNLLVKFVFHNNYESAFEMEVTVRSNQIHIIGEPSNNDEDVGAEVVKSSSQMISTPFFPFLYPRDYEVEYTIQCRGECQVHVNFIDFQMAPVSVLELVDYEGERVDIFTGLSLRPRIVRSKKNSLVIRFMANGGIGSGFNAEINFISSNSTVNGKWNPKTDCGGIVDRLGGAITMMKMTDNELETEFYDCIWIIRPSNKYYKLKTFQSINVASLSVLKNSHLTLRRGTTSKGDLLAKFSDSEVERKTDFVTSIEDGFYIHLRGNFSQNSSLALVYTVFSYSNCYAGSDFICANHKCIPNQVHCDGFDHCGDDSDEPATCALEWQTEPFDRQWYKFIPNYYFPSTEYDLRAASILFVSTSAGLVALIACLFLVLYRINVRTRNQRELQGHLQTISELLDQSNRPPVAPEEDEPPTYEAPPEYDEVIKVGMEKEIRRSKRKNREDHRRRRSKQPILDTEQEEEPTTSYLTEPFPVEDSKETPDAEESEVTIIDKGEGSSEQEGVPITPPVEEGPVSNGFLIVFQNDEPAAVPVHEFIPFERESTINTCRQCEISNQLREDKVVTRLIRRFSADPLLRSPSPDVELGRSFRL